MFFTAAVISGRWWPATPWAESARRDQFLREEDDVADGEVDLRAVGGDERVDVADRAHRLFGERCASC